MNTTVLHSTLLVFLLLNTATVTGAWDLHVRSIYVSLLGHDSNNCGNPMTPCKSIGQAVLLVARGGHIYIDGNGTEHDPYECKALNSRGFNPGIFSNKSVIMEGFRSTPHIFCPGGFHFQKSSRDHHLLDITMSKIAFNQTSITCNDCRQVEIFDCSFQNAATTAISVRVRQASDVKVNILASHFYKNFQCFQLLIIENTTSLLISIDVKDSTFVENGSPDRSAVISLASELKNTSSLTHIQLSFYKTKCFGNRGILIDIDIEAAITSEVYTDVRFVNNSGNFRKTSPGSGPLVDSLYSARVGKTHVTFVKLFCSNNALIRCLCVQSKEANIIINNSSFIGQSVSSHSGSALYLYSQDTAYLAISDTRFRRNTARNGGAIYAHCATRTLTMMLTRVNFTKCAAGGNGIAMFLGKPEHSTLANQTAADSDLKLNFRNVRFQSCFGLRGADRRNVVHVILRSGRIMVENSSWVDNVQSVRGALFIDGTGGRANLAILGCKFINNTFDAIRLVASSERAGTVVIANTVIGWIMAGMPKHALWTCSLRISPKYNIRLINVTLSSCSNGLRIFPFKTKYLQYVYPVNILVDNCVFRDNFYDMIMTLIEPSSVNLTIRHTTFTGESQSRRQSYAVRLLIPPLKKIRFSNVAIEFDNVTFDSRPPSSFSLLSQGNKVIKIRRSKFFNCVVGSRFSKVYRSPYEIATGGITIINVSDKPKKLGCVDHMSHNTHPLWSYNAHVVIEDTVFEENAGFIAGAVYVANGYTRFERCTFRNNFGVQQAGHIYSAYETGQIELNDCFFSKTKENLTVNGVTFDKAAILSSESAGPINIRNTSMVFSQDIRSSHAVVQISSGGYVYIDEDSTIHCSRGSRLFLENTTHFVISEKNDILCRINVTGLKYSCISCPPGFYSLQKGVSHGLAVNMTFNCLPCPFGATCVERNVAAKPNFWGYRVTEQPSKLRFIPCPENYCEAPKSQSLSYNHCHGNRTGILCGACSPGFTEVLFSTECQRASKCGSYWLWVLALFYSTGVALYLLRKPPIVSFLSKQILWFRRIERRDFEEDLGRASGQTDKGYLKIMCYFYQALKLLLVDSVENESRTVPYVHAVVDLFNFQILSFKRRIGCPIAGLTAVTKEFVLSLPVFMTISDVCFIYCLHCVINLARGKEKPASLHYLVVAMEVLLLGYERLAETSLTLMHCVHIGSEKRLFLDGNVRCWQWWQYILLLYNVIFVVPFMFVLYWGSSKLYEARISTIRFLCACVFPLPFLIYWSLKSILKRMKPFEPRGTNSDVLKILHGPFRPPSTTDSGALYWESVLIGRRFILLAIDAFVTNAMLRMVCMTGACVLMLLHHFAKSPYRDSLANKAETLSLTTLLMMAVLNLTKAAAISFGISKVGPDESYFRAVHWLELSAIGFVPAVFFILIAFAILSQLGRLLVFMIQKVAFCANNLINFRSVFEELHPLLNGPGLNYEDADSFH